MLDLDTQRELYSSVATVQACNQKCGTHIIKRLESLTLPEDVRDDIVEQIQFMLDSGYKTVTYLERKVCVQVDREGFKVMEEKASAAALEFSQNWDSDDDDSDDDSDKDGGTAQSRKRKKPNQEGKTSVRAPKKSRESTGKEGGMNPAQAPASNDGGNRLANDGEEQRVVNQKAFLDEARRRVEEIEQDFRKGGERVMVANLRLVDVAIARVKAALDSEAPNLSLINDTMILLARFTQNLSPYENILAARHEEDARDFRGNIVAYNGQNSIGSISCQRERQQSKKRKGPSDIPEALEPLAAAIKRFDQSERCNLDRISNVLALGNPLVYLMRNINNCGMLVQCGSTMTMHELYLGHEHRHNPAQRLWAANHQGSRYNQEANGTTIVEYIEKVLIPALCKDGLEPLALEVSRDMKGDWTDTHMETRREGLRHFRAASSLTLDGGRDESQEDYCGSWDDKTHKERRVRMTCLLFDILLRESIEKRLPNGMFSHDFVRTLLLNSPTVIKRQCDFLTREAKAAARFRTFFDSSSHGAESEIAKGIKENVKKNVNVGDEVYVIDSVAQIDDLKRLLEL